MAEKTRDVIVGADTHKGFHAIAVISMTGERLGWMYVEAKAKGYSQALEWARSFGTVVKAGIEATGSYGAGICACLRKHGIEVWDVYAPDRQKRYRRGKHDAEDAFQAAEAALGHTRCAQAKEGGGLLQAAQLLEMAYGQAKKQRTATVNALKAAVVALPDHMRERLGGLKTGELVERCAGFRMPEDDLGLEAGIKTALRSLARRIQEIDKETALLEKQIKRYAQRLAPETLSLLGVGPHSAIKLMCAAGENIGRMKGEASFAMLCGASPIECSSGTNIQHRLNRGGNRQANCALHTIAVTRLRCCEESREFYDRKIVDGKTEMGALRALKRYIAREVFYTLKADLARLHPAA
ncbi:MAG: IS110 family transposase [Eggerthellaceae bacterium]|nr:IS110 family transposase [Eggerthellaceae bacterium]